MEEKYIVSNTTRGRVSFSVYPIQDKNELYAVAEHKRRKAIRSATVNVVIPHGASIDLVKKTGISVDHLQKNAELNQLLKSGKLRILEICVNIEKFEDEEEQEELFGPEGACMIKGEDGPDGPAYPPAVVDPVEPPVVAGFIGKSPEIEDNYEKLEEEFEKEEEQFTVESSVEKEYFPLSGGLDREDGPDGPVGHDGPPVVADPVEPPVVADPVEPPVVADPVEPPKSKKQKKSKSKSKTKIKTNKKQVKKTGKKGRN